jgi:hypothetical protein
VPRRELLELSGRAALASLAAGASAGKPDPVIVSMFGWPAPYSQYHAANAFEHWLVEIMLTRQEPHNAERLLLSTGIVSYHMESNRENGRYSAVGRHVETPLINIAYRPTAARLSPTSADLKSSHRPTRQLLRPYRHAIVHHN